MKKQIIFVLIFLAGISFNGSSQAAFTSDVTAACSPVCANFTDQTPNATSWLWDFGDATSASTLQDPSHCYINPGMYTITLTATTPNGTSTATGTINVYPTPQAQFTTTQLSWTTISFTDQSNFAISWYWDFGDASTSTLQNPVHTYAASGNYTAYLIVVNAQGCMDSTSNAILTGINDLDVVATDWSIYPNPSNGQFSIHFDDVIHDGKMLRVENMLGQAILEKEIAADTAVDLFPAAPGIYFVRVGNSPAKKLLVR